MEKAVLVYTISDDKFREEFVKILTDNGWKNHKDQSTLILPQKSSLLIFDRKGFNEWLHNWSQNKNWAEKDFIQVFFPLIGKSGDLKIPVIDSIVFRK